VLIPSIDLMSGRIVQLRQGEHLALESDDIDGWIARFEGFPVVQLIDLDAAMGRGDNGALVRRVARALPCQVGGGIRTPDRAAELLDDGARRVIVGSALYDATGVRADRAATFAAAVGYESIVAAVDSRGGQVVIHGWKTTLPVSAKDAMRALAPHAGRFLYTHVDTEGLLTGLDLALVRDLASAAPRPLIAAGGIRDLDEVHALDRMGVDAVVGMAIYTDKIKIQVGSGVPEFRGSGVREVLGFQGSGSAGSGSHGG
jgi:phosphoribosylformimino-5-aminoimidazole carboxamide ribotide isomerase